MAVGVRSFSAANFSRKGSLAGFSIGLRSPCARISSVKSPTTRAEGSRAAIYSAPTDVSVISP